MLNKTLQTSFLIFKSMIILCSTIVSKYSFKQLFNDKSNNFCNIPPYIKNMPNKCSTEWQRHLDIN